MIKYKQVPYYAFMTNVSNKKVRAWKKALTLAEVDYLVLDECYNLQGNELKGFSALYVNHKQKHLFVIATHIYIEGMWKRVTKKEQRCQSI